MNTVRRTQVGVVCSFVILVGMASSGAAHETWLQPISFFVDRPAPQTVHMTSGMGEHYSTAETPIAAARVARSGVWFSGAKLSLTQPTTLEHALALTWTPTKAGVGAVYVELAAKVLNLPDSLIDEYFDEIGASPELRKQWTDTPSPKQWRESYAKHAKTYVRVGDSTSAFSWRGDTHMELEIVPEADPTRLAAGDTLPLAVRYKGQRMPRFTIAAFREGTPAPQFIRTDAAGHARLPVGPPGSILLAGVHLRRVHETSLEWRSDFTTMTFRVRARR